MRRPALYDRASHGTGGQDYVARYVGRRALAAKQVSMLH